MESQCTKVQGQAVKGVKPKVFERTSPRPQCGRNKERVDNSKNHFLEGSQEGGGEQSERDRD